MNHPYYSPSDLTPTSEAPTPSEDHSLPANVRRHFSKLGLSYLIMTVTFMGVAYALQFAVAVLQPDLYDYWWFSWALSLLPLYAVGLPVLLLCLKRVPVAPHNTTLLESEDATVEKPRFGVAKWFILLLLAFGCMTLGGLVGNSIMSFLSAVTGYDYAFALNSMVNDTPVWFTIVCTCICAPFGEELLFRKLLIDRTRRYGDLTAILLSGVLFGLFHGNLFQFFYAALVGMILAYVYTRSGKYLPCVAMHAAINFMGSVVTPALSRLITPIMEMENPADLSMLDSEFLLALAASLILLAWQYGTLIAAIVLFCCLWRTRVLAHGEISLKNRPTDAWLNPGMIACLAVMLVLVAINLIPAM